MTKIPPIAKIYEAYSCIADNRITITNEEAIVNSSDNQKKYQVKWKENDYSSTDNASFWQGYPGYPIIACLMLQNKITYNKEIIPYFSKINWHELNNKYKRNYEKAIEEVLNNIDYDTNSIKLETEKIYEELKKLTINIKRKI